MAKEPRQCECGCGEMTKGGRFRPGHDSRMHSKKKQDEKVAERISAAPVPTGKIEWPTHRNKEGIMAGMLVEAQTNHVKPKTVSGVVFSVSPFGWVAFVDGEGHQWIGYPEKTTLLEADRSKIQMTPIQQIKIARLLH